MEVSRQVLLRLAGWLANPPQTTWGLNQPASQPASADDDDDLLVLRQIKIGNTCAIKQQYCHVRHLGNCNLVRHHK